MTRYLPHLVLIGSAAVLGSALASQFFGGLAPCEMCIWQRWPHAIAIALMLLGILIGGARAGGVYLIAGIVLLGGAAIGVFHAGVELKYWDGPGTCSGGDLSGLSTAEALELILNAPLVRCDEIAWSFWGLSMASWNAICSTILAAIAFIAAKRA
ncbi:MAG: disulfide bond formation protein B [Pikeienuella sp.]